MKKLISPGNVLVKLTRWRTVHPGSVRVFHPSPYAYNVSPGLYEVSSSFGLKSGTTFYYHYAPAYGVGYAVGLVNNLSRVGPALIGSLLGGKLFNPIIRPNCISKSVTPP
jgi:hypothetical protein